MPPKKSADAWEDDWETLADVCPRITHSSKDSTDGEQKQVEAEQKGEPVPKPKLNQKERRAQHAQLQRELWDNAYVRFCVKQYTTPGDGLHPCFLGD